MLSIHFPEPKEKICHPRQMQDNIKKIPYFLERYYQWLI
jgi:hypothetical protein